jgi:acyl carrier protein
MIEVPMPVEAIRDQVKTFIVTSFPLARKRKIGFDDALLEDGIIDSLGVLDIVGFIQTRFQIEVSDEDLFPENFQTIGALAGFIERRLHAVRSEANGRDGASGRS